MEQTALLAASLGAMLLTAASGLVIVPALRRLHFGQTIKEIGPTWHQGKNGTPTMGGLTFYFGSLFGVVLGYTLLAVTMPELTEGLFSPQSVQLIISVLTAYLDDDKRQVYIRMHPLADEEQARQMKEELASTATLLEWNLCKPIPKKAG